MDGMFKVTEEQTMLRDLVKKFVRNELMPLEKNILDRFASGQPAALSDEENQKLFKQCKELGLWALDVPEEAGGANLPAVALVGVNEELGYTCVPFTFPPDSPNLHMMLATVNPEQRKKYLEPYAAGETTSAIAISEPGAGGDPAGMKTKAVKDGDHWVINGRKIWISRIAKADFTIVMAVTDPELGSRGGITAFLVDKGTPGLVVARAIPMLAGQRTYEVVFEDCRVHESQVLGRIGAGFAPMQLRLTVRRLQMGSWCVGMTQRALDMLVEHANQRVTFGQKLADRQAIQWWVRRRRHQAACLPPDGDGRRGQAGRGPRRAHGGLDDQGLRHRDGDRGDRPRPAGVRRHGRDPGAAAGADGAEGAHHAGLRGPVGGAPYGDRAPHPGRPLGTAAGGHGAS